MLHRYASIPVLLLPLCSFSQTQNYPIGSTVPNFSVTDTEGGTHDLYAYTAAGKHVMLDFFFYNCAPCQANAPAFSELYQTYGCNDGDLICISINDGSDSEALAEQFGVDFGGDFAHPPTIGPTDGAELTSTFGVSAFPTFCLIGTDNKIKDDDIWPLSNGMASLVASFPPGSQIQPSACVVGMSESAVSGSLAAFPSPTSGPIAISMDLQRSTTGTISIHDALGQVVFTADLGTLPRGASNRTMDLGSLADGQYVLSIHTGDAAPTTKRILIAH